MKNLLIAGGGHSSLSLIKMAGIWKKKNLSITLVSADPYLIYSGTLPQFIAGFYEWGQTSVDLKLLCDRFGVRFIRAQVHSIRKEDKTVFLSTGHKLPYDFLVINTGAVTDTGTDATSATSPILLNIYPVKPFSRLLSLREKICSGMVKRLLIAGGGAAGTEFALNFSHPDNPLVSSGTEIHLIEQGSRILSAFSRKASRLANRILSNRSVNIQTHTGFYHAMAGAFDAVILATGNKPVSSSIGHGFKTGAGGRILTAPKLVVEGEDSVFAAGDTADVDGKNLAQIGVHAVKQGFILRNNIDAVLHGKTMTAYRPYPVNPLIISNGPDNAFLVSGKICINGRMLSILKHMLDMNWLEKYTLPQHKRHTIPGLMINGYRRSQTST